MKSRTKKSVYAGPYTKPILTAIKLDPRQAILGSCLTAGSAGWMNGTTCVGGAIGTASSCATAVRGVFKFSFPPSEPPREVAPS